MLEVATASGSSIETLVKDLDVLIRARYPLISVSTFEEGRFRRLMGAVANLERHKPKGLFVWSRTQGLRQVAGPNMGVGEKPVPGAEDPVSVLEHIAQAEAGLYILCDFGAYLVPDGLPDPLLVRQLRELAWAIKARPVTVLFVGPTFPDIPALEKEVKTIDLPLPDEREVAAILDLQLDRLGNLPDVRLEVSVHTREQLVSALLGLTETEIENALAKAAITRRGIDTDAIPLILDEKRSVIRQTGALTYSHPESADHLGGYAHLRGLLHEAAATFSPAARAFGVEPHKGLLLVGLPGCGKDLCAKVAASVLGRPLLNLDMAAVMGEGGGIIGSAATSIRRALSIATTLKGILGLSRVRKRHGRPPLVGPLGWRRDGAHHRLSPELDAGAAGRVRLRHRQRRAPTRARADPPGPLWPDRVRRPAHARGPRRDLPRSPGARADATRRPSISRSWPPLRTASPARRSRPRSRARLLDALPGWRSPAHNCRRAAARAVHPPDVRGQARGHR